MNYYLKMVYKYKFKDKELFKASHYDDATGYLTRLSLYLLE